MVCRVSLSTQPRWTVDCPQSPLPVGTAGLACSYPGACRYAYDQKDLDEDLSIVHSLNLTEHLRSAHHSVGVGRRRRPKPICLARTRVATARSPPREFSKAPGAPNRAEEAAIRNTPPWSRIRISSNAPKSPVRTSLFGEQPPSKTRSFGGFRALALDQEQRGFDRNGADQPHHSLSGRWFFSPTPHLAHPFESVN